MKSQREWAVILPFRSLEIAKTRLELSCRRDLALAFLQDTLAALKSSSYISAVIVVSRSAKLSETIATSVVEDQGSGIDDAVAIGHRWLRDHGHRGHHAVVMPDLPALRTNDVDVVFGAAGRSQSTFVADSAGDGTTCVTTRLETMVSAFGENSAQRHTSLGYQRSPLDVPSMRFDVDTFDDLARAAQMGVGYHTRQILANNDEFHALRGCLGTGVRAVDGDHRN